LDNYRLLLALFLSLGIIFLYNQLLEWRHPELAHPHPKTTPLPSPGNVATPEVAASGGAVGAATASAAPKSAPETAISAGPARDIVIDTDLYRAEITTRGGRIESFLLKKYRATSAVGSPPYQMAPPAERLPLGLTFERSGVSFNDADVVYRTDAADHLFVPKGGEVKLTLVGTTSDGLTLRKTFAFHNGSYVFDLDASAAAPTGANLTSIGISMSRPLAAGAGYRDIPEIQADIANKSITEMQKALQKGVAPISGPITYAGFGDRYFLSVVMPVKPIEGLLTMGYAGAEGDANIVFPGASNLSARVYFGPKDLQILEAANPALRKAIDFGWSGIIALPFLQLLELFHRFAPNYGVAIILLTVVVRLATLPMSIKGQRSMMKMQRLQPQVERIREKFKDDQERLNREMVDLYKRNHVNPLGGCLPMAVQLPVFIALYEALLNAIQLRHAPFFGWIKDLSAPDCLPVSWMPRLPYLDCHGIPVLVGLLVVTGFLQQWMAPKQPDPSQQKMMMYMPIVFSLIFVNLPAGLTLYYLASNVLGIAQQFVLNREFQQLPPTT
jgi:YidC/Oxa1 family membrane protein insertase